MSKIQDRIMKHGVVNMGKDDSYIFRNFVEYLPNGIASSLSVGCGSEDLSVLPGKVTGLDINKEFESNDVVIGDMHDVPFKDCSFDLVWVKDVFEHSVAPIVALSEMARVSKKYVMIILPTDRWLEDEQHILIPSMRQLVSMANKCGLSLMKEGVKIFAHIARHSEMVRVQEFNYYLFRK